MRHLTRSSVSFAALLLLTAALLLLSACGGCPDAPSGDEPGAHKSFLLTKNYMYTEERSVDVASLLTYGDGCTFEDLTLELRSVNGIPVEELTGDDFRAPDGGPAVELSPAGVLTMKTEGVVQVSVRLGKDGIEEILTATFAPQDAAVASYSGQALSGRTSTGGEIYEGMRVTLTLLEGGKFRLQAEAGPYLLSTETHSCEAFEYTGTYGETGDLDSVYSFTPEGSDRPFNGAFEMYEGSFGMSVNLLIPGTEEYAIFHLQKD